MRVGQIWQWIYQWGVRDFAAMTNLAKSYRAELAERFVIEIPEVVTKQVSSDGTRKYLVRIAGGHEVEVVYIPEEDRGTLCISLPGRLHADLFLLPHRHPETGAQPDRGRDRRPDHGGPRRSGRMARAGRAEGRDAPAVQHRADGHGRAALQFRERARRDEDRHGPRGYPAVAAADHPVDLWRGARDRAHGAGDRLPAGGLVPRHHGCGARPAGADQQALEHRGAAGGAARLSQASAIPSGSPSNT